MTRVLSTAIFAALLLAFLCEATQSLAKDGEFPTKIRLYPSVEPRPALKYKLLPSRVDQISGNAAVYYGKVTAEESSFFTSRELWENIDRWQKTPLGDLLKEEARVPSGGIDFQLDRAARCRFCDWQMPVGDVQFYATLLPEVQQIRQFGRLMAASARIEIANKRYDRAIHQFQTNFALGRHVAEGEFVVSGLVGVAICGSMNEQIMEFVQQPDTPNLYWALTTLPSPLIDMRAAVELESHGLTLSYPELGNYEGVGLRSFDALIEQTHPELWKIPPSRRTAAEWKSLYHAVVADIRTLFADVESEPPKSAEEIQTNCQKAYPLAKQSLRDRGMALDQIESISMHQAVLLFVLQVYRDQVDDVTKYYCLPYPEAIEGFDAVAKHYRQAALGVPQEFKHLDDVVSGIKFAKMAETRIEREIAVLRVLEALRIYGAARSGDLPKQLSEITEVPLPNDPVTGNPFAYRLQGNTAVLQGPSLRGAPLHYEITMNY